MFLLHDELHGVFHLNVRWYFLVQRHFLQVHEYVLTENLEKSQTNDCERNEGITSAVDGGP